MNKTKKLILNLAGICAAVGAAAAANASTLVIDGFALAQDIGDRPIPGNIEDKSQVGSDPSILGGFRDGEVQSDATNFLGARFRADNDRGLFSSSAATTGNLLLTYDGDDDPAAVATTGLGGADLTLAGTADGFAIDVLSADLAGAIFDVTVWDMAGNSATVSSGALGTVTQLTTIAFDFDAFGGVDLASTGAVQLALNGVAGLDLAFDNFRVSGAGGSVPAPAAYGLFAAGFAVVLARSLPFGGLRAARPRS